MKRIKHGMIVGAAALLLMTGCGSNASTADLQKQIERLEAENAELKEQIGIENTASDSSTDDNGIEYREAEITNYMLDTYVNLQIGYTDEFIEAAKQYINISEINFPFHDYRYNNDTDSTIVVGISPDTALLSRLSSHDIQYDIKLEITQDNNTFTDTLYSPYCDGMSRTYINCHSCFKSKSTSDIMIKATVDLSECQNNQLVVGHVQDATSTIGIDYSDTQKAMSDQPATQAQLHIENTGNTYGALTYKFESAIIGGLGEKTDALIEAHLVNGYSDIIAPGESTYIEYDYDKDDNPYLGIAPVYLRMSIIE